MSYRLPVCFVSTICPVIIMLLLFALNLWWDTCNAENEIFRNFRLYNFLNVFNYVSPWIPVTNDNCVVYVYYCHCMLYNNFVTLSCIYFTFTSFWHICMHGMSVMKAFDLEKKTYKYIVHKQQQQKQRQQQQQIKTLSGTHMIVFAIIGLYFLNFVISLREVLFYKGTTMYNIKANTEACFCKRTDCTCVLAKGCCYWLWS